MSLSFGAKLPGPELRIKSVEMDFDYGQAFGGTPPEAYERLLLDAMKGDATLYARGDWVDLAWELLSPVLDRWATGDAKLATYEAGTWGAAGSGHPHRAGGPPLAQHLAPHCSMNGHACGGRVPRRRRGMGPLTTADSVPVTREPFPLWAVMSSSREAGRAQPDPSPTPTATPARPQGARL